MDQCLLEFFHSAHGMQQALLEDIMIDFEFDELKREFLGEAEEKIREIQQILDRTAPLEGKHFERLIYLSHQLKGAGGSYGFESISNEAAALERDLEAGKEDPGGDLIDRLRSHAGELASVIELSQKELSVSSR